MHALQRLLVAFVALAIALGPASATNTDLVGAPLIQRFTTEDYQVVPRHLSVLTDRKGRVFIGTLEGVLVFSHGRFTTITLPSDSSARKMVEDEKGRIHVAGYDHFGYLRENSRGEWTFVDLDERFPDTPGPHALGDVWDVALLGDRAYYLTADRLYEVAGDSARSWATPAPSHSLFVFAGALYIRVQEQGLVRFEEGRFSQVAGGATMAKSRATVILPAGDAVFIGSRTDGFFRLADDQVTKITTPLDDWFRTAELYCGLTLPDGTFAIGALNGEVLHLDGNLNLLDRFQASGYPIVGIGMDHEGGLWAATDGDLVRAAWPSPWTQLTDADGLLGSIEDSAFFGGRRYVATSMGLFAGEVDADQRARFRRIPELGSDEVWDLAVHDGRLFVAHRFGVWQLSGAAFTRVSEASYPYEVVPSVHHAGRVYALSDGGLIVLERGPKDYAQVAMLPVPGVGLYSLVESDPETVFVGNFRGEPVRLTLAPDGRSLVATQTLGPDSGVVVEGGQLSSLGQLDGRIVLGTRAGLSVWKDGRFAADPLDGLSALVERPDELSIREAADGRRFAFTTRQLFRQSADGRWEQVQLSSPQARGVIEVGLEPDGLVSVVTWGALLTLDPAKGSMASASPPVGLHRVDLVGNKATASRLPVVAAPDQVVAPHRLLRFAYGVNSAEKGIEYRSWLKGFEPGFTGWGEAKVREFSGLAPRRYELRIEARAPSGRTFAPLTWGFTVQPRWYQTHWAAWALAALVLTSGWLLAWGWSRWRSRQLRARNLELERSIEAHTRELEVANQRLARLAVQDGLTGVTNRRGFEQAYARLWNRLAESRQALAVLMVDVDFFKQYNDANGHLAGDEVLRRIARALESEVHEPNEVLARFGGEEFAILLPNTQIDEAMQRAQQVRARCEDAGRDTDVTVSVGVAVCVPRGGLKPAQLLDEADAALYRAKKAGRNRVERGRTI